MTSDAAGSPPQGALDRLERFETAHPALEGWREALFSSVSPTERSRSGSDAVRLILATLGALLVVIAYRTNPSLERWWIHLSVPPPTGLAWLLTTLFFGGTFGVAGLLCVFALLARRRGLAYDLVAAAGVGLAVSYAMQFFLGVSAGRPRVEALEHVNVGFPVPILVAASAMVVVGRPYLARGLRRLVVVVVTVSVAGALPTGRALPLALLGSLVIGLASALLVRLWRGRPRVAASAPALSLALGTLGIPVASVGEEPVSGPLRPEWGVEHAVVTATDGSTHRVSIYGRDTRDAELLSSLWRLVTVRESGVAPFVGRQQQAEHEALTVSVVHEATGGASPRLEGLAATGGDRDVLVVTSGPGGSSLRGRLGQPVTDDELAALGAVVAAVHRSRVALGAIDPDRLGLDDAGRGLVLDTLHAELNATEAALSQDVADLLVLLSRLADVPRAVSAVHAAMGAAALTAALAYLERPALSPVLRHEIKDDKAVLEQLRQEGARVLGVLEPKLAAYERVSPMTLVLGVGTIVGGWALLGVFANLSGSISTLRGANWAWVVLVLVVAQLSFLALGVADLGSVPRRIPLLRLSALEVANAFAGLTIGAVTVVATRVRFLQRQGVDAPVALSSSVLVSLASWIVKAGLFAAAVPFAWKSLHFTTSPSGSGSHGHLIAEVLVVVIGIGVAGAVLAAVPRWRHVLRAKLSPKVAEVHAHLRELAGQPRRLVEVFGGTALAQLVIVASLGGALHAFGSGQPVATLIVVVTIASVLRGVSPVPGGVGVVEAGLILGLTSAGVPQSVAVAAVFVQRLATAYLPPLFGYVSLVWLRRRDYL